MSFANPISGPDVKQQYLEMFGEEKPVEKIVSQIHKGLSSVLVLMVNSERVGGFCIYQKKTREIFIDYLAVNSSLRGGGLGTRIMEEVYKQARELNCGIRLLCADHRITFYERLGFKPLLKNREGWNVMVWKSI